MRLRKILFALCLLALMGGRTIFANVDLLYFRAESSSDTITLVWETETELDNLGFHLWRSQTGNQTDAARINAALIPSQVGGQPIGAVYEFPDSNVQEQVTYTYWLESVDFNNHSELHGPIQAALGGGSIISTPVPGGADPPEPTRTTAPATATTAAANPTPVVTGAGSQPTATRPNPTATIATVAASPTAAAPLPTSGSNTTFSAPVSTEPAGLAQPTESFVAGDNGQPQSGETLPDAAAVTPIGAVDPSPVAANDTALAVQPTATFIASENLAPVGEQDAPDPAGDGSVEEIQSGDNWRQTVAVIMLIIGVLLTAGGGFALWLMSRRSTDSV
jgi:hypothetical protein